ncbi:AfsR/SARP family transcriptional regulator [Conexibacter woesei]|uniref:Transcriptional regulator, SARP family n=1 Tax=Conexibacter woesei (strain DSM 14684 / CCUG 47730 / CIP 108061 / JCM 11494 / NBRC 100937 / ID131577) TaxID=469383 RepID=D3F5C3_CONWI|nr:BTAD domain-containing putative transcriptional regulator [Conexibacter woesei]ADB50590.1 transcriptional regulator, SARP family [Conexibacter woesei DSM 14684]
MEVSFGVLGPIVAWDRDGAAIALRGPRHRAVLARLLVADGRVVPLDRLVDDLWLEPPEGAIGAVRTFVSALRRAIEPQRAPRTAPRLLVTEGPGYALRAGPDAVDARRFEAALQAVADADPAVQLARLEDALRWWRGPAYAGLDDAPWARTERARLAELRLHAVERRAAALLALGRAAAAVPDLDAHVAEHPWREEGWRLLALALYRSGRQADALAVLQRARRMLVAELAIEPGPALRALEHDILVQAEHLTGSVASGTGRAASADDPVSQVWAEAAAAYDRATAADARARLETTVGLLRDLAVTGGDGLQAARRQRVAAVAAAEELSDPQLTARVIGAFHVPASWTRLDDPEQAATVVAAAERTLARLPRDEESAAARARLLATIALESRGSDSPRPAHAAREAEAIARRLDNPALLAFALNGRWMQRFERAGLAPERDAIGAELLALAERHGLVTYELLGHLIRLQARSALADFAAADGHAAAVDRLATRHELPLARVFTGWYRALRLAATGTPPAEDGSSTPSPDTAEAAYRAAAAQLDGAGMPGLARGLPALALLCLRVSRREPAPTDPSLDWGPYTPWARPLVLLADGDADAAAGALRAAPEPPPDLLLEATWCLIAQAALALGDRARCERTRTALAPAASELAGAGSGFLTAGPVADHLAELDAALTSGR